MTQIKKFKRIFLLGMFCATFIKCQSQDTAILFEQNSSWAAILAKAKVENKYIFVDCFTTWCAPCMYMKESVFKQKEVANFFNNKFVNAAFQFDTTTNDANIIKLQYGDAACLRSKYNITAYPTYLFFSPEGEIVQVEAGRMEASQFISKGVNALDPEKQYYTQAKKYNEGNREPIFLRNLTILAKNSIENSMASKYAKEYIRTQTNLLSNQNMQFLYETTSSTTDTGFTIIMNNIEKFELVVNKSELLNSLRIIVFQSEMSSKTISNDWKSKEWLIYSSKIRKTYPLFAEDVLLTLKTMFYGYKNEWREYATAVNEYVASASPLAVRLNRCAFTIFEKCTNQNILRQALAWSKKSFTHPYKSEPDFMDTYANLLYKLGKPKDALDWELKARKIAINGGAKKDWGLDVIKKIKNRQKTW
jgi:thiol-disulfide isomerase/thioredoxin